MVITSFHLEEKWEKRTLDPDSLKIEDVYLKNEQEQKGLMEMHNQEFLNYSLKMEEEITIKKEEITIKKRRKLL